MTPAKIAAAPWWRWCEGLRTLCGHRVHSVEGGVWALRRQRAAGVWAEVRLRDPKPDPSDPLLPGWLLHLLRERVGDMYTPTSAAYVPQFRVWVAQCGAQAASGATEVDAIAAALDVLNTWVGGWHA